MASKFVRKDEQIRLIMECRQSGLSDYQWCQRNGIKPGTFYNWVSKLRKSGYTFPDSKSKSVGAESVQDVVKVNLVEHEISNSSMEQNACPIPYENESVIAAELLVGNIRLRIFNGAESQLIQNTLQCLGGVGRAW